MSAQTGRVWLVPLIMVAASVLIGIGCGVVNPDILGTTGANAAASTSGLEGNIVILVVNDTTATTQANVSITKMGGGSLALNIPVAAGEHQAVVQNCDVTTIQVQSASYAGTNGAVLIPAAVSPLEMGLTLQCGGVVAISISGTPPGVFLNVQSF